MKCALGLTLFYHHLLCLMYHHRHLRFLNLGYNLIECVENLDNLNIQELNLEYNCITDFKSAIPECGISTLPNLRTLILRHNKLSRLEFFEVILPDFSNHTKLFNDDFKGPC